MFSELPDRLPERLFDFAPCSVNGKADSAPLPASRKDARIR